MNAALGILHKLVLITIFVKLILSHVNGASSAELMVNLPKKLCRYFMEFLFCCCDAFFFLPVQLREPL